jgi:hypothetical protein
VGATVFEGDDRPALAPKQNDIAIEEPPCQRLSADFIARCRDPPTIQGILGRAHGLS